MSRSHVSLHLEPATGGWTEDAACVGHDPEWWFQTLPVGPKPRQQLQYSRRQEDLLTLYALTICNSCPVMDECLKEAEQREGDGRTANRYGVFGGLLPDERGARARKARR